MRHSKIHLHDTPICISTTDSWKAGIKAVQCVWNAVWGKEKGVSASPGSLFCGEEVVFK